MKINDVEKLTGLTAKSIRYYESKGLITVEHDAENGYRIYTERDVLHLKRIKLLRHLEFGIEEIRHIQAQELPEIRNILQQQAEKFETQGDVCDMKKSLCISLSKDYDMENNMVEEYDEAVDFLEGEQFEELQESIKELTCLSLPEMILLTFAWGAPVLGLFLNIDMHSGNREILTINAVVALLGVAFLTLQWRNYFYKRKYQKKRMKDKGKRTIWLLLAILPILVVMIAVLVLINELIIFLFAPEGWLFYEFQGGGEFLLILITEIPLMGAVAYLIDRLYHVSEEKANDLSLLFGFLWKHKEISLVVWCALIYLSLVNVTFVTPDKIISYSTMHPAGVTYDYSDITKVDTSFGGKTFAIPEYKKKGNFSYRLSIGKKKLIFSQPYTNDDIERYEDSYLELEEFDAKVMSYRVPKEGSTKYSDYCDMDSVYVERFLRIIRNGNKE
ncbi:MAG: MerR family transcriptional regulator [Lachnospiraceae bacterium]|nr:MerR family transcriptional regulator [Lachnospiraceae bacterium]